ncbi:flagellar hook protein FlgE [Bryobacter aggregatus]|uniref:flagellar hook protein FlgE n=1 Tax=Bryobacter aggregatus TaxID=360054 RepID=UPI0004E1D122|nr:flagellar hook protein FlgE [Bryobacter aggregatus]
MFTSFSTALSALGAHATAVDVVGNNLANLNTTGFKASSVSFYDLVTQSLGAGLGETQVGFGVGRPVTLRSFSQGAIQNGGSLDAAIQGDGFLILKGQQGQIVYSRGGSLVVDKDGTLLTGKGYKVQGWTEVNGVVDTNAPVGDIVVPVGSIKAPIPSTSFQFDMNLNAAATAGPPADSFKTSIEVFDSLGSSHIISVSFTKSATANSWDYSLSVPDADVSSPVTPVTGTMQFNGSGQLVSPDSQTPISFSIPGLVNGASDMTLNWQIYNGQTPRITQYSQPSAVSANYQDGQPSAQLVRVGLGDGGRILAQYSNGVQSVVGQLAMASIRNPESLVAVGDSAFQLSERSALPAIGSSGTGGRGQILGGSVEASNVDIAKEFTNLIILQRGYQANTRVITTVDEISQETINLKR